ncbi:inositol oxygenase family protein [Mucilaginibacter boryungensis]|uniref:Inositol oxygenase n=1 Tax=Mucilaginibacter boryungensis TaxID=768480 RepID=A0ABR9XFW5_9SPHI|nr:inositol oxygenase family protein [Mucilaginibacter boryungensis]MBE9665950.1 inositol oxygenase [Mucilaginibacter boryungensis]
MSDITGNNPLTSLDEWENDLLVRYPDSDAIAAGRDTEAYRDYESTTKDSVREFYRLQHINQTYDFVLQKKAEYLKFDRAEMTVWEAFDFLNQLIDDSDPDTDLDQLQHLLQTSEAIRNDNRPDWMVLTGLFHDLGKVLCLFGEPQWAVVGDSYPVGCAFSDKIVFSEYFKDNKDHHDPRYNTKYGIYEPNCGLENVHMTWGHDEYIYHIMKPYLPEQALYMLRYHSFYPQHREKAYSHLMTAHDHQLFKAVDLFNPYDLYSKSPVAPNWKELRPYYEDLVAKYLPATLKF